MNASRPFASLPDEPLLNIKAVSQATGIEAVTLRAWERRYGVPSPERSEQGYRLYSDRDVAILRWLKARVEEGVTIGQAVSMLETQLPQALPQSSVVNVVGGEMTSFEAMFDDLIGGAHAFDAESVQHTIMQAFALFPVEDVCLNLLAPALAEIGRQWRMGEASLQVEHFLTNLVRQHLLALDAAMPPPSRRGRVLLGCGPDDWHEMAVLMLSLFLRRRGWQVVYLGQAVGLEQLETALASIRPDVVVLSASAFESLANLPDAARLVQGQGNGDITFMFGGALFPHVPGLAAHIPGVYVGDSLLEALQRVDDLLGGSWNPAPQTVSPSADGVHHTAKAIRQAYPHLVERLAESLLEAEHTLSPAVAHSAAAEDIARLLAALDLELPELLSAPEEIAGPPLSVRGVPVDSVQMLFVEELGSEAAVPLDPYLPLL
jgi:DNA-binding transcriptional MerR regulator/methylmalonyl-CoA mutase cobalamin-binding subunit